MLISSSFGWLVLITLCLFIYIGYYLVAGRKLRRITYEANPLIYLFLYVEDIMKALHYYCASLL